MYSVNLNIAFDTSTYFAFYFVYFKVSNALIILLDAGYVRIGFEACAVFQIFMKDQVLRMITTTNARYVKKFD